MTVSLWRLKGLSAFEVTLANDQRGRRNRALFGIVKSTWVINPCQQLHIKAKSKSTQIIHEMLQFCKKKLQTSQKTATLFFNDLLFTNKAQNASKDDKIIEDNPKVPDSMLCYENKAFENRKSSSPSKKDETPNEVKKAFQKGKTSGIWLGKMYQKLDDLQEQWSEYLKNSKSRSRRDRAKRRRQPTTRLEDKQFTKPLPRVKKAPKKQEKSNPKQRPSQVPLHRSSIAITKSKKPKQSKKWTMYLVNKDNVLLVLECMVRLSLVNNEVFV